MPTGSSSSYDTVTGRAKVTWSENQETDLAGTARLPPPQARHHGTRATTTTATSYTYAPLPLTGGTCSYEVRAYDTPGNRSAGTTDRAVTTTDRTAPAVPQGAAVTDAFEKGVLGDPAGARPREWPRTRCTGRRPKRLLQQDRRHRPGLVP
ncbi:hypothetical protein [Streptomyces rhizosphaerihabitans]|uniref:hypothetical protein n=1 Tax=Streptomyces rhizosphaerihabitans TaxID=1266770 RepID=UPI0021C010F5|nr:hypothetical protein [Streptomyces rhizosphaerihabitans]MCT9008352.1 hypothetical protein [Streptomyces rhizosphaerihabitans]